MRFPGHRNPLCRRVVVVDKLCAPVISAAARNVAPSRLLRIYAQWYNAFDIGYLTGAVVARDGRCRWGERKGGGVSADAHSFSQIVYGRETEMRECDEWFQETGVNFMDYKAATRWWREYGVMPQCGTHAAQSCHCKAATRVNSRALAVITVIFRRNAWPAINRSYAPMGRP